MKYDLNQILQFKADGIGLDISRAIMTTHDEADSFVQSDIYETVGVIEHAELVFECCRVTVDRSQLRIIMPRLISDHTIIGWEGCKECHELRSYLPMMDAVTLTGSPGFPLESTVKKLMHIARIPCEFPLVMERNGIVFHGKKTIERVYGMRFQ